MEGRDYCICAGRGATGQSCLTLTRSPVRGRLQLPAQWCLNPLRSFQSDPFARAHRISAWSHVRARLALGKADRTPPLSEAELNRPPGPRGAEQESQKLLRSRRARPEPSRRCRECRGNAAGTGDGQGPGSIISTDTIRGGTVPMESANRVFGTDIERI